FPLILNQDLRSALGARFIKAIVDPEKSAAYRSTYAVISDSDFNALKRAVDQQDAVAPEGSRRMRTPWAETNTASEAFRAWAEWKGWRVLSAGYPDLLAELPNRRISAFEAKLADDLRPDQKEMFAVLRAAGLRISV